MREEELREHATCSKCGLKIGHTGLPLFWTVKVQRFGLDAGAMQRQHGLAAIVGSAVLARAMGPDEELAKSVMDPVELTLCEECVLEPINIAALVEAKKSTT
jgi:hypothetical protein